MKSNYDVIVIGAGHNGLTAANFLAQKGFGVLVLERKKELGGVAGSRHFHSNYSTEGLLTDTTRVQKDVLAKLNIELDSLLWNEQTPPCLTPTKEGPGLNLYVDPLLAESELAKISTQDAKKYKEFRAFIKRVSGPVKSFLQTVPPHFEKMTVSEKWNIFKTSVSLRLLGKKDMLELMRIPPMSVADWLDEYFESDVLKASLALTAVSSLFAGPHSPGTAFNLLIYEVTRGVGLKGGAKSLVDVLVKKAETLGVEIVREKEVVEVLVEESEVKGVRLASGEDIKASRVLASSHLKTLFLKLMKPENLSPTFENHLNNFRHRGTTAVVNLAIKGDLQFKCRPDLKVESARIVESMNELEKAFDAVKYKEISQDPALEVSLHPSNLAPSGHHSLSILVHYVPYELKGGWTQEKKDQLGQKVLEKLKRYCLEFEVIGHEVLTPVDLEKEYFLEGGHLHHGEHSVDQLLVRPIPECARYETPIRGLYLCGSGSFPGGNLTCLPGYLCSQVVS
jgi:phytoene dehydrogenase-like protein